MEFQFRCPFHVIIIALVKLLFLRLKTLSALKLLDNMNAMYNNRIYTESSLKFLNLHVM